MKNYFVNLVASLSNFLNVLLGGNNSMTFSSRSHIGYWKGKKIFVLTRTVINYIFFWQKDHCKDSFMRDVEYSTNILKIYDEYK